MSSETQILKKYKPLFIPPAGVRYFIITGGRGSGKSFSVEAAAAAHLDRTDRKMLLTRYTMKSAEKSIIPEFREKVEALNLSGRIELLRDSARGASGGNILFSGIKTGSGDQTANLKSLHDISMWVVDEAEELTDEKKFDTIDLSIRSKKHQNIVVLLMNPATKEHWVYKRWFEDKGISEGFNGVVDDVCYIHTTYIDNKKFLDSDYFKKLNSIKDENPEKYRHVVLGGWLDKAEGVIFENWKYGDFDDTVPYLFGMDFGFSNDPDALVKVGIDGKRKKIYAKLMIYRNGLGTMGLSDLILKSEAAHTGSDGAKTRAIVADSSEGRLISDLQGYGINVFPVVKWSGSILAGIKALKNYEIIVHPDSTEIGKELNNYVWADKKIEIPIDMYNHAIDAIRYAVQTALSLSS